jgi:hypothetical protein
MVQDPYLCFPSPHYWYEVILMFTKLRVNHFQTASPDLAGPRKSLLYIIDAKKVTPASFELIIWYFLISLKVKYNTVHAYYS